MKRLITLILLLLPALAHAQAVTTSFDTVTDGTNTVNAGQSGRVLHVGGRYGGSGKRPADHDHHPRHYRGYDRINGNWWHWTFP